MKKINYFPFYELLLTTGKMKTGFRLGRKDDYKVGDKVMLTVGWPDKFVKDIGEIKIIEIKYLKISNLTKEDFEFQSPECSNIEQSILCLSAIYRKIVSQEDRITMMKWETNFSKKKLSTRKITTSRPKTQML